MAGESLLSSAELLAGIPDNSSQLVDPLDVRNLIIALPTDSVFLEDEADFTIPIVDSVAVSINPLIPSPAISELHWQLDGNQAFIPDWAGIIVNAGLIRTVTLNATLSVSKPSGGNDNYEMQFFIGGVAVGAGEQFEIKDIDSIVSIAAAAAYDHSIADPIDLRVTGVGTGDDLDVSSIQISLRGSLQ